MDVSLFIKDFELGAKVSTKLMELGSLFEFCEKSSDVSDQMGAGQALDGETTASHGTTGFGVSFSGIMMVSCADISENVPIWTVVCTDFEVVSITTYFSFIFGIASFFRTGSFTIASI